MKKGPEFFNNYPDRRNGQYPFLGPFFQNWISSSVFKRFFFLFPVLCLGGTVTDDHTPFVEAGLDRVFYVITRPFPDVWHTIDDNRGCLDFDYISRGEFNKAFVRRFIATRVDSYYSA